jgi:serine/threonine protein phosphatase 1
MVDPDLAIAPVARDISWPATWLPAPASLPAGTRIYAIGDIHGCTAKLVELHYAIAADLAQNPVERSVLIHLGDVIDRGADSAGVLWLLSGEIAPAVTERIDLRGNHETLMLNALAPGASTRDATLWLDNGGDKALKSYGIGKSEPIESWAGLIPPPHLDWLRSLRLCHSEGGYLFVHAGIRPGIALDQQDPDDLIWIRDEFLYSRAPHPLVVVHGHSMVQKPEILKNRIGIDTGAVMGNVLTCLVLEAESLRFLKA